jgi:hypothetical protein
LPVATFINPEVIVAWGGHGLDAVTVKDADLVGIAMLNPHIAQATDGNGSRIAFLQAIPSIEEAPIRRPFRGTV